MGRHARLPARKLPIAQYDNPGGNDSGDCVEHHLRYFFYREDNAGNSKGHNDYVDAEAK
jgi:hypothetical protein